jgi:hypothetical protein
MVEAREPIDEAALRRWIAQDLGIEGERRLVRDDGERVLVSKFEAGFAAGVHDLIAVMPELFAEEAVRAAYERAASGGGSRVEAWHRGMHAMLRAAGEREGISELRQAEVRTGIDSVYAVLGTALWSDPRVGDVDYEPGEGERRAYREALASLSDGRDVFTRVYGRFAGRVVENHCPGAAFARVMLEQGWVACTGTPAPRPDETPRAGRTRS